MPLETEFIPMDLTEIPKVKTEMKDGGWRCLQMLCTNTEAGIDLTYSFQKDNLIKNYQVRGVTKGTKVPSITDAFIGVFPFENEAHDLFGVEVEGIAIDFKGHFYDLAMKEPMTVISPEKKAAMDKAAKIAAAKAAKAAKDAGAAPAEEAPKEDMEAKLAGMDPEKAAKVRAAMEAKAKREAAKIAADNEKEGE